MAKEKRRKRPVMDGRWVCRHRRCQATTWEVTVEFKDILYGVDGGVATITMNRPKFRNALSYRMLDEIDAAFTQAGNDRSVRVVVLRGAGGTFSSGHDLGTPEALEYKRELAVEPGTIEAYDQFKRYNLDVHLR